MLLNQTLAPGLFFLQVFLVGKRVQRQFPLRKIRNLGHHLVQKAAIMRNGDQYPSKIAQPPLQPLHALRIQMVGRFIHQQDIGTRQKDGGKRNAHPPPTGKFFAAAIPILRSKTKPAQNFARLGIKRKAPPVFKLPLSLFVLRQSASQPRAVLFTEGNLMLSLGKACLHLRQPGAFF